MGVLVSLLLPLALVVVAGLLARRELQHYREAEQIGSDLFLYTKGRLWRRMTGLAILVVLAGTLAALELAPASTPGGASVYMALLVSEVAVLIVLAVVDLWETARTARPQDLTRQGGSPPRTRTRPRHPR